MTFRSYCQDIYILKAEDFGPFYEILKAEDFGLFYEHPFIDPGSSQPSPMMAP
jgi:hypothetical protein